VTIAGLFWINSAKRILRILAEVFYRPLDKLEFIEQIAITIGGL